MVAWLSLPLGDGDGATLLARYQVVAGGAGGKKTGVSGRN